MLPADVRSKTVIVLIIQAGIMSLLEEVNGPVYGIIPGGKGLILALTMITALIYAFLIARAHAKNILNEKYIHGKHTIQLISRGALMGFLPLILFIQQRTFDNLSLVVLAYATFGLVFDDIYNHFANNKLGYVGTESSIDRMVTWINSIKIFRKIYPWWYLFLKLSALVLTALVTIKYYVNA